MKIKKKMLPIIASALAVFTMTFSITASAARNHTYTTNLELIENTNISDSLQSAKVSTYGLTERIPIRILDCSTNNYTDSTFNSIFMDTEMESYSPSYFPTYRKSNISTYAIVGNDNRTAVSNSKIAPYSATCYIRAKNSSNGYGIGTGFLIDTNLVLTCAHLVYDTSTKKLMSSVEVFPAMNGSDPNITGLTKYSAKRIVCSGKYISSTSYEDDWAIIELDGNPGSRYGWLGLRWRGGFFVGDNIWNTGYPGGKDAPKSQNKYGTVMMLGKGKILDCDGHTLKGAWDATVGNSGGPVFSPYSYGGYDAIGILSTGSGTNTYGKDYGNAYTTATRFTRGMYDLFVRCKNKGISSL